MSITAEAACITKSWTLLYKPTGEPATAIVRVDLAAQPAHQLAVIARIVRGLMGIEHGRARETSAFDRGVPLFPLAAEGPDGAIAGLRHLLDWARSQRAAGRVRAVPEADFGAWAAQESTIARARKLYGLTPAAGSDADYDEPLFREALRQGVVH